MPLDHLVYAVPVLADAIDDVERLLGVRAAPGGQHVGRGTHNALLALGDARYLEIIAPDPDQPEPSDPRPFGVEPTSSAHLAGWAWRVDDIDAAVAHARERGYDTGDPIAMHRRTTDGVELHWRLTLNARAGGAVPFLIDWGDTPHPSGATPTGLVLRSLRIEHPEPGPLASTLAALGAEANIAAASRPALIATVDGPLGTRELH
jgi:hypothetical protein